ncbi:amino acid ABC transporter permease [Solwaraspora sp. WMMD1047]|uniref:amino acid ABC transporter permease n=1 Tax=Solwaraspora sp. WMMD1047 TaxID=3016102 RepID=UPI00241628DB|nr:amino acid ABC transporter permease [Solwaraspora sp. WMMD1047]MDG4834354.1 amino acid ABC transporter permease [Solwaraspora sp. WMMD1047]
MTSQTTQVDSGLAPGTSDDVTGAVRRIRPGRIVAALLMVVLLAQFGTFLVRNERFQWGVVWEYLFDPLVLQGVRTTVLLTAICMVLGIAIGIAIAAMRMSSFGLLSSAAWGFTRFFYGVPLLVQLIFWFNLAYLVPELSIGIPFGPSFGHTSSNDVISPFTAAILGLALHEGAYMSEVVRAGLISVDPGQRDASRALGLNGRKAFRLIILPQAMRFIVPPTTNQVIGMLKGTALVSTVAVSDLLYQVSRIYDRTFQVVPLLLVACIWYFVLISVLDVGQRYIERRFERSTAGWTAKQQGEALEGAPARKAAEL